MDVNNYILSTELATFKNDSNGTVFSVTIPSGLVFNPSSPIIGTDTKTIGTINSGIRAVGTTSKYSGTSVGNSLFTNILVNISGTNVPVSLYVTLRRINPTDLQMRVEVEGVSGSPNYTTLESQTITFVVSTFLSPFDN